MRVVRACPRAALVACYFREQHKKRKTCCKVVSSLRAVGGGVTILRSVLNVECLLEVSASDGVCVAVAIVARFNAKHCVQD